MAYVDYAFYTDKYMGDILSNDLLNKYVDRASDKLDSLTFNELHDDEGKIIPLASWIEVKVKKCVCKLAEILYDIDLRENASRESVGFEQTAEGQRGKVITSVSSGAESISYGNSSISKSLVDAVYTDSKALDKLFYDTVSEYLTGTGLLYGGF